MTLSIFLYSIHARCAVTRTLFGITSCFPCSYMHEELTHAKRGWDHLARSSPAGQTGSLHHLGVKYSFRSQSQYSGSDSSSIHDHPLSLDSLQFHPPSPPAGADDGGSPLDPLAPLLASVAAGVVGSTAAAAAGVAGIACNRSACAAACSTCSACSVARCAALSARCAALFARVAAWSHRVCGERDREGSRLSAARL